MSNEIEQIKERLGVADIIGEYVKLEKAGVNYKALCPFHNEKTPSFMVNTERNFWYCFGCQEGGDIFSFVQKIEGLDFREALEKLAERANVKLPKFNNQKYQKEKNRKQKVYEILELTTKIYQRQLLQNAKSKEILQYLKSRNFTGEVIKEFRLGYAPDGWRTIVNYLLQKRYSLAEIKATGLVVAKSGKENSQNVDDYYDRFRDRITFPIIDVNGRVVGFSARVAPGGDERVAKYINSPQSEVYNKSKVLYGIYQAKQAIRQMGYAIIVEGNADVVLSHRSGIKNVVAVSGTAMRDSEGTGYEAEQVKLLKRYTNKVKLCFDMDEAGQKATGKSVRVLLQNDLEVKVILLPNGFKDVGDLVSEDQNKWKKVVRESLPIMDYYFETTFKQYNIEDIQEKKKLIKQLLDIIRDIGNPVEQSYWLKKLAIKTETDESLLTDLLEQGKLNNSGISVKDENKNIKIEERLSQFGVNDRYDILQCRLLGLLVSNPKFFKGFADRLMQRGLLKGAYRKIIKIYLEGGSLSSEEELKINECYVKLRFQKDGINLIEIELDYQREWQTTEEELYRIWKQEKIKKIELKIKQAEYSGQEEVVEKLMTELMMLLNKNNVSR